MRQYFSNKFVHFKLSIYDSKLKNSEINNIDANNTENRMHNREVLNEFSYSVRFNHLSFRGDNNIDKKFDVRNLEKVYILFIYSLIYFF